MEGGACWYSLWAWHAGRRGAACPPVDMAGNRLMHLWLTTAAIGPSLCRSLRRGRSGRAVAAQATRWAEAGSARRPGHGNCTSSLLDLPGIDLLLRNCTCVTVLNAGVTVLNAGIQARRSSRHRTAAGCRRHPLQPGSTPRCRSEACKLTIAHCMHYTHDLQPYRGPPSRVQRARTSSHQRERAIACAAGSPASAAQWTRTGT